MEVHITVIEKGVFQIQLKLKSNNEPYTVKCKSYHGMLGM